jgi:hypothetical protein
MKNYLLFLFLCIAQCALAQTGSNYNYLNVNDTKALFNANADMFYNLPNQINAFNIPAQSSPPKTTIAAGSLWIGALDKNKNLHVSAMTYRQSGIDFWPGPLDTVTGNANTQTATDFDKVWKMTWTELVKFRSNNDSITPDIRDWPGNSNSALHQAHNLAPYYDANSDYKYNPADGDYPLFKGDEALFWVFNDNINHGETSGNPLGVEVHAMAYAYDCAFDPIKHTIFVHYEITNRSANDYDSLYAGQWTDFDLGYPFDDYVGCDSTLGLFYGYNGAQTDSIYGSDVPAQGVIFLNQKMSAFSYYSNDYSAGGNPMNAGEYYKLLNGTRTVFYPNKYSHFMYNGDPVTGTGLSEVSAQNYPGDRRGVGACGPFSLKRNQTLKLDIAFVTGIGTGNYLKNVTEMKRMASLVREYYNGTQINCNATAIEPQNAGAFIKLYPNPASSAVHVNVNETGIIQLLDMTGRSVKTQQIFAGESDINVAGLQKGVYFVHFITGHSDKVTKLLIQ